MLSQACKVSDVLFLYPSYSLTLGSHTCWSSVIQVHFISNRNRIALSLMLNLCFHMILPDDTYIYIELMDYLSLFVSAFHNGCINCVIHNNPNFHTRQRQPNSSCQTQRKPMNTERREYTLSKQNGMIFGLYRSGTHILAIISEKAIKSIQ